MFSITPKVYKVDYEFLINNYLDKSLWKKEWNLYIYLDHIFTLSLYSIDIDRMRVCFKISHNKLLNCEFVYYYLEHPEYTIEVLKKQINSAILSLMRCYEMTRIRSTSDYKYISDVYQKELSILEKYVDDSCVEKGIINQDIVCDITDRIQETYSIVCDLREEYLGLMQYFLETDLMLLFCRAIGDEVRLKEIQNAQENEDGISKLISKINDIEKYLDDGNLDFYRDYDKDLQSIWGD